MCVPEDAIILENNGKYPGLKKKKMHGSRREKKKDTGLSWKSQLF